MGAHLAWGLVTGPQQWDGQALTCWALGVVISRFEEGTPPCSAGGPAAPRDRGLGEGRVRDSVLYRPWRQVRQKGGRRLETGVNHRYVRVILSCLETKKK